MAARVAYQMAMESPHIRADVVEITEFPHLAQRYQVRGVPKTVINEKAQFEGAVPEAAFLDRIKKSLEK
jgi:predicted DsbA family dithiol-disulfide isomerase